MKILNELLLSISIFFLLVSIATANDQDGFDVEKKMKTKYFKVYVESDIDTEYLALQLTVPTSLKTTVRDPVIYDLEHGLAGELDSLYLVVSEVLDIHLRKKLNCNIKICRDAIRLLEIADKLFGQEIQVGGFYVVSNNTIYVDADNISIYILGHELAHAIQNQYFMVQTPVKIQEVLSGYVEFQLRKYS